MRWPNPRLQRTPSAAPPSPLSRKPFGDPALRCLLAAALLAVLTGVAFSQNLPSLLARSQPLILPQSPKTVFPVYADQRFRFLIDGGGRSGGGPPILVVCRAGGELCREVYAVTTSGAVFGCYPCDGPSSIVISVTWDFREYRHKKYVSIPLRTSGSYMFPRSIRYDSAEQTYTFLMNPELPSPYATTLRVRAADLENALSSQ